MPAHVAPPPDLPATPEVSGKLSDYLRRFSIWARQGLADRPTRNQAVPGVLVQAYDTASGATPKVFMLRVDSSGAVSTVAMPLGTGLP